MDMQRKGTKMVNRPSGKYKTFCVQRKSLVFVINFLHINKCELYIFIILSTYNALGNLEVCHQTDLFCYFEHHNAFTFT